MLFQLKKKTFLFGVFMEYLVLTLKYPIDMNMILLSSLSY